MSCVFFLQQAGDGALQIQDVEETGDSDDEIDTLELTLGYDPVHLHVCAGVCTLAMESPANGRWQKTGASASPHELCLPASIAVDQCEPPL